MIAIGPPQVYRLRQRTTIVAQIRCKAMDTHGTVVLGGDSEEETAIGQLIPGPRLVNIENDGRTLVAGYSRQPPPQCQCSEPHL